MKKGRALTITNNLYSMRKIYVLLTALLVSVAAFAQEKTFDVTKFPHSLELAISENVIHNGRGDGLGSALSMHLGYRISNPLMIRLEHSYGADISNIFLKDPGFMANRLTTVGVAFFAGLQGPIDLVSTFNLGAVTGRDAGDVLNARFVGTVGLEFRYNVNKHGYIGFSGKGYAGPNILNGSWLGFTFGARF